ncbi:MAG: DUF998 domain-containing protein [Haliscomenobacter sp.]|uniref:DUF998 domain-containing protein n=1 Tax=Haliscomenobacter sp. TaxID=2717303 RepID=UPI0029ADB7E8|nr:DUF998 domain-containing protein [Haliscomenobacter sp.]MDX2069553.1 DUF998 domain-containing protein [Haliscomenobacter sp.]
MDVLAVLSMLSGGLSLFCLLALHFVSPEFHPSWRMISEYALGKYKGLLSAFFFLWGACTILSGLLLWNVVDSIWASIGVIVLFISGLGAIMGGLFDIKHPKHGLSFMLGVPTLPLATLLIGYHLLGQEGWSSYRGILLFSAHTPWISLVLMGGAMALLFSGFKKAGYPMGPDVEAPEKLPEGVIPLAGYANRLLVLCYLIWPILVAFLKMNLA